MLTMSGGVVVLTVITLFVILLLKKLFWKERIPYLIDKHILITGGSSGIGKSVALEAAKLGAHITIVARDVRKLERAVDEISALKPREDQEINFVALDVSQDYNLIEQKIQEIEEKVGFIFMLVNCVGQAVCKKFENATESDFRQMMNLNYLSTVYSTQIVAKLMMQRRKGCIVICGSQASLLGVFGMSAYCGAKFALRGYAETLYMELMPYNVSVTLCLPPDTNTPGFEKENLTKPEETKLISQSAGLFEPDEVARQMLVDALKGRFFSTVGVEGYLLTTLCAGMSPVSSASEILLQICLMSFFRLIGICYQFNFRRLILNCSSRKKT